MPKQSRMREEAESCVLLQKRMRGILARRKTDAVRAEEMAFLGFSRPTDLGGDDPFVKAKENAEKRKLTQKLNQALYEEAQLYLTQEIDDLTGLTKVEETLKERREWVQKYKLDHNGKYPNDANAFYVEQKKAEAEAAAAEEEEMQNTGFKRETRTKKGGKAGKKDDSRKGIGANETVRKFDAFTTEFADHWEGRDESKNLD
jgi:hypothetical protein